MSIDREIQRWVVTHRLDVLDPAFVGLSAIGSYGLVWIGIAGLAAVLRRRPEIVAVVVLGVLSADLLARLGKEVSGRERPYVADPDPEPLLRPALDLAFPSGHAATSFAGAALLAWFAPRFAVPLYALAVLVAWSRVYVGVHYPADILAGAALGLVVAVVLRRAALRTRRGQPV